MRRLIRYDLIEYVHLRKLSVMDKSIRLFWEIRRHTPFSSVRDTPSTSAGKAAKRENKILTLKGGEENSTIITFEQEYSTLFSIKGISMRLLYKNDD